MRHASRWKSWLLAVLVVAALSQIPAVADNVTPRATDPTEHTALMKMGALMRHTNYEKTAQFLQQHPDWRYAQLLQTKLAFAKFKQKDHRACKAICEQILSAGGQTDLLAKAWAQDYKIRCLVHDQNYAEALEMSFQVINASSRPGDLTPVLAVQRGLGWVVRKKGVQASAFASAAAKFAGSDALVLIAQCMDKSERGDLEGARTDLQALTRILPAGDARIALAGTGLVMNACYGYDRDTKANVGWLARSEPVIADIEQACSAQRWLIARAKLSLGSAMTRSRSDLVKAERYCRDVISEGTVSDLLPEANGSLAICLAAQRRYEDGAEAAKVIVDRYPYSTWADFAAYLRAECVFNSGNKTQAVALWDEMIQRFPESGWVAAAKLMKEVPAR